MNALGGCWSSVGGFFVRVVLPVRVPYAIKERGVPYVVLGHVHVASSFTSEYTLTIRQF